MIKIILLVFIYLVFPVAVIFICRRWSFFSRIGTIVIAYAFGLLFGNIGILPHGSEDYIRYKEGRAAIPPAEFNILVEQGTISEDDSFANQIARTQDLIMTVVIPLALPMLLFSLNIRKWFRYAGTGFLSMILALVSVVIVVIAGYYIFRGSVHDSGKVAGMLVGIYTGGTPNVASIKAALNVDNELFLMTHTSDLVIGAVVIIFLITLAPRLFSYFLPAFRHKGTRLDTDELAREAESVEDYGRLTSRGAFKNIMKSIGAGFIIFAIAGGISLLGSSESQMMIVILVVTTLGILASLIPAVNRIDNSFQTGMYLILIFSFVVSSMADLSRFFTIEYVNIILFVAFVVFGSLILHLILSAIFRVNVDDFLITTTALVYSPPFVPVVAGALKNKEIIITGLTVGVIGYAIGNYIGISLGGLLP
ncbi:MAG TPA: DUF819 family protein [Bacteroidetes bacterium]|nr:DUF819 family protein [Bacteroidota bacterium]